MKNYDTKSNTAQQTLVAAAVAKVYLPSNLDLCLCSESASEYKYKYENKNDYSSSGNDSSSCNKEEEKERLILLGWRCSEICKYKHKHH